MKIIWLPGQNQSSHIEISRVNLEYTLHLQHSGVCASSLAFSYI